MLKLKLQYFLMQRADSLEKTLMLGKIEGKRRRGVAEDEIVRQHHLLKGHEFEQTRGDSEGWGSLVCCSPWGHRVKHDLVTKQQQVEKCAPCNITKAPMLEEQHSVHFAEAETKLMKGR